MAESLVMTTNTTHRCPLCSGRLIQVGPQLLCPRATGCGAAFSTK